MTTITNAHTLDELLVQLAEEAAELAKAAARIELFRRLRQSGTPDVLSPDDRDALVEEIANVNVAAEHDPVGRAWRPCGGLLLRRKLGITADEIADVEAAKIERWRRRLGDAAGTENR